MGDSRGAYTFGEVFTALADDKLTKRDVAEKIWALLREYDFADYEMECDEALIKLGLAKKGIDPDWPDLGVTTVFKERK